MTDSAQNAPQDAIADAYTGNWVDHRAPAALRPYFRLSRLDRPIGTWLLLLPCWWGLALATIETGPRLEDLWIAIGCGLGAILMRGAGCTWNDITDRKIDGSVTRTARRPIPSGAVSVFQALLWMAAQCALALLILVTFDRAAILLGLFSMAPVVIYPFAKRFTWWPQVFLGIAFNWGALLAYAAHKGSLGWPAILLYLAGICWTLFYDTIYAHQDAEDDALIGVKSTARLFGEDSPKWLADFGTGAVLLMAAAILAAGEPIALIAPIGFAVHLIWQWRVLDIHDGDICLKLFRSNRDAGLIAAGLLALIALF
ncbi:4-hydroxybenzoate octaprenyltransferase [Paracoccaceae bacterium GXU_MW_L88]